MRTGILIWLWLLSPSIWAAVQPNPFPQVANAYLVEIDGAVVWEKQADIKLPPASLTKLMTALLVLETGQEQEIVFVGNAAAHESGSRLDLHPDDRFHVQDLLAATLVASANDACHALADHLSGNEANFVMLMNQRAQQLKLTHTRFRNACGHDDPDHYSTARDLARLAHEILKHPRVLQLSSQPNLSITTLGGRQYNALNKNALIGRYEGALGLKTGYTEKAGKCLIAYAKRGGHEVLLILLHGKDRWWDAADILDLAFAHARTQ